VPDDALIEEEPGAQGGDHKPVTQKTDEPESRNWGETVPAESSRSTIWKRRTDAAKRDAWHTPAEVRTESATAPEVEDNRDGTPTELRLRSEIARPVQNTGTPAPGEPAPDASPSN